MMVTKMAATNFSVMEKEFILYTCIRLTTSVGPSTRPIPITGSIPQMDIKSDVIPKLGRFFWRPVIGNESSIALSKWRHLYLLQSDVCMCVCVCVCVCLLSDPSNNNSVISSGTASLGLNIAAGREADSRKHRGRARCSHEEIILLWLRRYSF